MNNTNDLKNLRKQTATLTQEIQMLADEIKDGTIDDIVPLVKKKNILQIKLFTAKTKLDNLQKGNSLLGDGYHTTKSTIVVPAYQTKHN